MKKTPLYILTGLVIAISAYLSATNLPTSTNSVMTPIKPSDEAQSQSIRAPQWSLKTQSGDTISLAQYQGQPVILHFWATWCPYCKKIQPTLEELTALYPKSNIALVGVSFNEDEGSTPQDVLEERGHQFITAIKGESVASRYGVRGTPSTFFINAKGDVVYATSTSNSQDPRLLAAVKEMIK